MPHLTVNNIYFMLRRKKADKHGHFYKAATQTHATPKLYLSAGMAMAAAPSYERGVWEAVEVKVEVKPNGCPNKIDGVCQMPNVHCGYPTCVE